MIITSIVTLDEARQLLGVSAGAARDEVKRAHRRVALAFHPDHHKGSAQFDDFQKRINVARDTLYREINRLAESPHSETDRAMETPAPPPPPPHAPRTNRGRPPAPPGLDEYREISFPFLTMLRGGKTRISVPRAEGTEEMFVNVPQGEEAGVLLHILGGGGSGSPPGDLLLRVVSVEPDPVWRTARADEGRPIDLVTRLAVAYAQVYTERLVSVQSPWETRGSQAGGTSGLPLRTNNFGRRRRAARAQGGPVRRDAGRVECPTVGREPLVLRSRRSDLVEFEDRSGLLLREPPSDLPPAPVSVLVPQGRSTAEFGERADPEAPEAFT